MTTGNTTAAPRSRGVSLMRSVGWPRLRPVEMVVVCVLAGLLPVALTCQDWPVTLTLVLVWMGLDMSCNPVLGHLCCWT